MTGHAAKRSYRSARSVAGFMTCDAYPGAPNAGSLSRSRHANNLSPIRPDWMPRLVLRVLRCLITPNTIAEAALSGRRRQKEPSVASLRQELGPCAIAVPTLECEGTAPPPPFSLSLSVSVSIYVCPSNLSNYIFSPGMIGLP